MKNPYDAYKKQSILTMTPGDMLQALYNEILKESEAAKKAIDAKDYAECNRACQKVQKILHHLKTTLDMKYEISNNLSALYDFYSQQYMKANIEKNAKYIDETTPMIIEIRDAFAEADKKTRAENAKPLT